MSTALEVRLIGPGGAGKSTIGALVAERLEVTFLDLDRRFKARVGDISEYIGRHGYGAYARENIETYCSLFRGTSHPGVVALLFVLTYARDIHPEYPLLKENRHTEDQLSSLK
jgi:shikimate kinase